MKQVLSLLAAGALLAAAPSLDAALTPVSGSIQTLVLDASRPLYVPTHPRVSTTIRFPAPVGAPEGRGFTEDETKQPGEYLVSWTRGESHFTIVPLENAGPLNLNVPFQNATYVFYFYPAESQFQALASLICTSGDPSAPTSQAAAGSSRIPIGQVLKDAIPLLSPARALGLIDRLKLVHAAPASLRRTRAASLEIEFAEGIGEQATMDFGLFELIPVMAARDPRLAGIVFSLRLRNKSQQALAFDSTGFGARQGLFFAESFCSDGPALLVPGEEREAFFVLRIPGTASLRIDGPWRLCASLLSPSLGAAGSLIRSFPGNDKDPPR